MSHPFHCILRNAHKEIDIIYDQGRQLLHTRGSLCSDFDKSKQYNPLSIDYFVYTHTTSYSFLLSAYIICAFAVTY